MKDLTLSQWPDEPDEENRRDEDHWYTKPVSTQDMKRLINQNTLQKSTMKNKKKTKKQQTDSLTEEKKTEQKTTAHEVIFHNLLKK